MSRSTTNFVVDAVAFAALVLLRTTGAITRYVLPPGIGHFSSLWGMDRNDWGEMQFLDCGCVYDYLGIASRSPLVIDTNCSVANPATLPVVTIMFNC
jgi:hypothetical protein